jgi:uncharacterized protein
VRLVIDTNILISALLAETSLPAYLISLWRQSCFDLLTSTEQLEEMIRVTRYPKIHERLEPAHAGRLVNEMRSLARLVDDGPNLTVCSDPNDNYLLAIAVAGAADFLVTGDKRDLLRLNLYQGVKITTVRGFLTLTNNLP